MADSVSEIRHLLSRYEDAQSGRDLATLSELHWQDERLTHTWSPGHVDLGWDAYEATLRKEFSELSDLTFHLEDIRTEVFAGKFAVVQGSWRCGFQTPQGRQSSSSGPVTFVLSKMGNSWKIVADHFSVA